jgi:hypothetical protein
MPEVVADGTAEEMTLDVKVVAPLVVSSCDCWEPSVNELAVTVSDSVVVFVVISSWV